LTTTPLILSLSKERGEDADLILRQAQYEVAGLAERNELAVSVANAGPMAYL
jgi:hypothetical protein